MACESSGIVRDAFRARGHAAISCDLLPSERPGPHVIGDVLELRDECWDLVIAHPPCTYLAKSGVRWLHSDSDRWERMEEGAAFFAAMFTFDTRLLAVENPIQHRHAVEAHGQGRPSQIIQPWERGHAESKATCLWLRGLPPLMPTDDVRAIMATRPKREAQRLHYLPPGPDRWRERSKTSPELRRRWPLNGAKSD